MPPVLICLIFLGLSRLHAQTSAASDLFIQTSPDQTLIAVGRETPDSIMVWNRDEDQTRLVITDAMRRFYHAWTIPRLIDQMKWSPDSKFLVLTTASPGGHSPWHFKSFVFCLSDYSLRCIDGKTIPSVVSPQIKFQDSHSVILLKGSNGDFEHPIPMTIDLAAERNQMDEVQGAESGKLY